MTKKLNLKKTISESIKEVCEKHKIILENFSDEEEKEDYLEGIVRDYENLLSRLKDYYYDFEKNIYGQEIKKQVHGINQFLKFWQEELRKVK